MRSPDCYRMVYSVHFVCICIAIFKSSDWKELRSSKVKRRSCFCATVKLWWICCMGIHSMCFKLLAFEKLLYGGIVEWHSNRITAYQKRSFIVVRSTLNSIPRERYYYFVFRRKSVCSNKQAWHGLTSNHYHQVQAIFHIFPMADTQQNCNFTITTVNGLAVLVHTYMQRE